MPRALIPLLLATAALSGCVGVPDIGTPVPAAAASPRFDPLLFFAGRLEGSGRLHIVFADAQDIRVDSTGRYDGTVLHLAQVIHQGTRPPRTRHWTIRQVAPGRYTGTLTDAAGAVSGETQGNRLRLAFTMPNGMAVEQRLTLTPDGRRAYNILTVRKFGVPVARLAEDIRKRD